MAMHTNTSFMQKLLNGYCTAAIFLCNTIIALVLLNMLLFFIFAAKDRFSLNPVFKKYDPAVIASRYPHLSPREVNNLLNETWYRWHSFSPFIQFKERPFQGAYVNVSSHGFRVTKNQGPWPPESRNLNIFLFGGSTTFGYGVEDNQTIASHLQECLTTKLGSDVRVYNFGCGSYYSTQERILYEQILASGVVPDLTVFIDGLNDFYHFEGMPRYTDRLQSFMDTGPAIQKKLTQRNFILETSLGRAAAGLRRRLIAAFRKQENAGQPAGPGDEKNSRPDFDNTKILDPIIASYRANKRMIEAVSRDFGVKPVFVWQPIPTYHYDESYLFPELGYEPHLYAKYGYARMARLLEKEPPGRNFFWCADIQRSIKEPLYVDDVHYSEKFSRLIAAAVADFLWKEALLESRCKPANKQ